MPSSTTLEEPRSSRARGGSSKEGLALVIAWSKHEPARIGEVLDLPEVGAERRAVVFGRGGPEDGDEPFVQPVRQRPGVTIEVTKVSSAYVSRRAIRLRVQGDSIEAEAVGRRSLVQGGTEARALSLREGDAFELKGLFVFVCVKRRGVPPSTYGAAAEAPRFGEIDAHGIVGESPAVWALRDRIAFVGPRAAHVLVTGESGAGKELVARAIHASSGRRAKKLVSRNAATLPAGLVDAELFGNVASYPNVGMPERAGLVGEADGATLFLDEIAELPLDLQAHLLRVLDEGEYQRLGDARRRRSDFRLLAATNGDLRRLMPELLARIGLRVVVPGLGDRREDIPLVAIHLARKIAAGDADLGPRFLEDWDGKSGRPRLAPDLVAALVQHDYTTHVRELASLLWASFASSPRDTLELTDEVRARLGGSDAEELLPRALPTEEQVRAALEKHGGVQAHAYRELGLPSRHALRRLLKKLGMTGA